MKKIAFACDHAAFEVRNAIIEMLQSKGLEVLDFGTDGKDSVDYPDHVNGFINHIGLK